MSLADVGEFASASTRIGTEDFLDLKSRVLVAVESACLLKLKFLNDSDSVICRRLSMHYAKEEGVSVSRMGKVKIYLI